MGKDVVPGTTDYHTNDFFEAGKGFLSGFDKNPSQATKIFFGCRNGKIILIPMKIPDEVISSCMLVLRNNHAHLPPSYTSPLTATTPSHHLPLPPQSSTAATAAATTTVSVVGR